MDMKWTGGPWFFDEDQGGDDYRIVGHPAWPCTRFGEKGVWDVAHLEVLDEFRDEMHANGQLIVSAPDLYEALAALRERTWLIIGVNDAAIKSADAALARARGETA